MSSLTEVATPHLEDVGVGQQEGGGHALDACLQEDLLEVVPELGRVVVLVQIQPEQLAARYGAGQAHHRGLARAVQTHLQERMMKRE